MQAEKIILAVTIAAAAALARFRFVNYQGTQATAGQRTLGVATTGFDLGEQASVATHGELLIEAGAAIAIGAEVEADAQGRAILRNTGVVAGVTREAATGAGDIVRILR